VEFRSALDGSLSEQRGTRGTCRTINEAASALGPSQKHDRSADAVDFLENPRGALLSIPWHSAYVTVVGLLAEYETQACEISPRHRYYSFTP